MTTELLDRAPERFNALEAPKRIAKLTIEVTTWCNLKCRGCPRTIGINAGSWRNANMSAESFERIAAHLPPVDFATLHGIGEPLLNEDLVDIVRIARQSGKFGVIKITSNGLTGSLDTYRDLFSAGLDQVWISVDSFDQATAEDVRSGTLVGKLRSRMESLLSAGFPVAVSMVVGARNYETIPDTLRTLHAIGNPDVHMQEFQDFGDPSGLLSVEQRKSFVTLMRELIREIPDLRIVPPNFAKPAGDICLAPWQRPGITVDGYLTPCCTTFDAALFLATRNLTELDYADIWAQPAVQQWIRDYVAKAPPICEGCALDPRKWGKALEALGRRGGTRAPITAAPAPPVG